MKQFIVTILSISIVFFLIAEILSKFLIDPIYFYSINTYNDKSNNSFKAIYRNSPTAHADFVFIGSSRIPATINPTLFRELSNGVTVNTGTGFMTPGIHYQALKNKLKSYPDYLKNSVVLIEYPGPDIYISSFKEDFLRVYEPVVATDKSTPHLLLPHLDYQSFLAFLTKSTNGIKVKVKMLVLLSSTYRGCHFMRDKFNSLNNPLFQSNNPKLVSEGGIRNDNFEFAKQKAITVAIQDRNKIESNPPLSPEVINHSSFSKLHEIVKNNGGTLMVYKMPLHSIQKDIYSSEKAQKNKVVFENWLKERNIPIIHNPDFTYTDDDFPDTWHLSQDRRDEFTTKLYDQINKAQPRMVPGN
ncbi:MAG: hypothetical protein RIC35_14305 [Marinoscillum sp.]